MQTHFQISQHQIIIRPWQKQDIYSLVEHANNRKVWDCLRDIFPYPYTTDDAMNWIDLANEAMPLCNFAIEIDGKAAGNIGLLPKLQENRKNIEVGYWLGEKYWGKGIMTEALQFIVQYAWLHFDVIRIYASIYGFNIGSAKILEKVGFKEEARIKNGYIKNDILTDEVIYSITKF